MIIESFGPKKKRFIFLRKESMHIFAYYVYPSIGYFFQFPYMVIINLF